MTTPRGRTSHVRPRPPSSGRPKPTRTTKPEAHRVRQHGGLGARRSRLPLPTRLLLALSVLALGGAVFLTATGGIGPVVATLGSSVANAIDRLVATPLPTASQIVATDSPIISAPASPYSRTDQATLRITIPQDVVGTTGAKLRVYVALAGLQAAPIAEVAVASSLNIDVPVKLTPGRNDFTASIVGGFVSESSPIVTIIYDKEPPKVTVKSPKTGTTVNEPTVVIKGATEKGAQLLALNDANGTSITGGTAADGTFSLILGLEPGVNPIHLTATDAAGNASTTELSYTQGSGDMTANLSASLYRISVSSHPASLQFRVLVTDPAGAPLAGASAFFTLQIPGLGPISGQVLTGADGRASFTTPLVGTIATGTGQATVLVTHPVFGQTTDRVGLTFVE